MARKHRFVFPMRGVSFGVAVGLMACSGGASEPSESEPAPFEGLRSDASGRIRAHVLLDGSDRVFEIGVASPALANDGTLGTKTVLATPAIASPAPATLMPSNLVRWAISECGAGRSYRST